MISGSSDAYTYRNDTLTIALPFFYSARSRNALFQQLMGRFLSYRMELKREGIAMEHVQIEVVTEQKDPEVETWIKELKQL